MKHINVAVHCGLVQDAEKWIQERATRLVIADVQQVESVEMLRLLVKEYCKNAMSKDAELRKCRADLETLRSSVVNVCESYYNKIDNLKGALKNEFKVYKKVYK